MLRPPVVLLALLGSLISFPRALADEAALGATRAEDAPFSSVALPLTLLDVPENFVLPYHAPSWEQALDVSVGIQQGVHLGLHLLFASWSRRWWSYLLEGLALTLYDVAMATAPLPLTQGWLHEEGHRATMGMKGVPSLQAFDNLFYPATARCDEGSVCGMTDGQVAKVKETRAADWVRVQEAGMETELEWMRRIERHSFFSEEPSLVNLPTYAMALFSVLYYRAACASSAAFGPGDVTNENADMLRRDFTGPDCTGWVYDLFRPTEPYAARGPHPNGDGLRRVRLSSDLSPAERDYLVRMRNLGFLNFIDPHLFGFSRFSVTLPSGRKLAFNASVHHDLTAFGDALGLELVAQYGELGLAAQLRIFRNQTLNLPGLAVTLFRLPLRPGGFTVYLSATAELWLQPAGLDFITLAAAPGGALELQAAIPVVGPLEVFATVKGKTTGWRMADPSLDAAVSGRLGVNLLLPIPATR